MRNIAGLTQSLKTTTLLLVLFVALNCLAQSPAFDAASVKLATEESMRTPGRRIQTSPGSLITHGLTLRACILWAYDMPAQIIGPDWLNTISLDIVAKASTAAGDKQLYQMLRTLLAERMGLKAHFEKREIPVYALSIAKGGPKFTGSTTGGPMAVGQDKGAITIQRVSMSELAAELGKGFDRPVIDRTALKGRYDVRIDMAAVKAASQPDGMDSASAMIATLRQIGLNLEGRKDSVDVLVVDHIEKTPIEN